MLSFSKQQDASTCNLSHPFTCFVFHYRYCFIQYNLLTLKTATSTTISFRATSGGSGGAWPIAALAVDESTIIRGLKNTPHKTLAEKNLPPQF